MDIAKYRAITFALACCLSVVVCFGLAVAIVAGIAYGYNYCMAEFITFTRPDATVFMRRGQFPEKPHDTLFRNSHDNIDYFSQNISSDYEELTDNNKTNNNRPLDIWMKNQETKNYAEKLTKYSLIHKTPEIRPVDEISNENYKPATFGYYIMTSPSPRIISVIPHLMQPTTLLQSGSSQILMRDLQPDTYISQMQTYKTRGPERIADDALTRSRNIMFPIRDGNLNFRNTIIPGVDIKDSWPSERNTIPLVPEHATHPYELSKRPQIPMHPWGISEDPVIADYAVDEEDDNSIIYKPV